MTIPPTWKYIEVLVKTDRQTSFFKANIHESIDRSEIIVIWTFQPWPPGHCQLQSIGNANGHSFYSLSLSALICSPVVPMAKWRERTECTKSGHFSLHGQGEKSALFRPPRLLLLRWTSLIETPNNLGIVISGHPTLSNCNLTWFCRQCHFDGYRFKRRCIYV